MLQHTAIYPPIGRTFCKGALSYAEGGGVREIGFLKVGGGLARLLVGMYAGKVSVAQWLELGAHNA